MNLQTSSKLFARFVRRTRALPHNINKFGVAHYTVNFHRKYENNGTQNLFSKHLPYKSDLTFTPTVPMYYNLQKRFISDKDIITILDERKNAPPMDDLEPIVKEPYLVIENDSLFECPEFFTELAKGSAVNYIQESIIELHQLTGLSWWGTLVLTGVLIRIFIVLPVAANQMRIKAKLEEMDHQMEKYKDKVKEEYTEYKRYGYPQELIADKFSQQIRQKEIEIYKFRKIDPNKVYFLMMGQATVWTLTSLAIRNLCHALPPSNRALEIYSELSSGGFSIMSDLTEVDPYGITPFFTCMINAFLMQSHRYFTSDGINSSKNKVFTGFFFQIANVFAMPVMMSAPLACNIYWLTSSLIGLIQVYLLHSPFVLRLLRTPPLDRKHPHWFYFKLWKSNYKEE